MRQMTLAQIAHLLHCEGEFASFLTQGFSVDSRLVKKGELFFALKGERVDGHDFLKKVSQQGAIGAVVSKEYRGEIEGFPLIRVDNPLVALQELGAQALAEHSPRIVAITGSLGKTTTKEFTKHLLSTRYRVAATPGNSNSQVGLPLAILNHSRGDEEIFVIEMGMTLPGHIARLVQIAPPEVAVITSVALVHACQFDAIEDIGRTKGEIFSHPKTKLGILHRDISNYTELCQIGSFPKISFSILSEEADYFLNSRKMVYTALERGEKSIQNFLIPGRHNLHNLLAAIAVARYFQVEWEDINQATSTMVLPDRRLQFVQHRNMVFLNDSYNAAEMSVKSALEILPQPEKGGRKIAVLGSMMELGKFSDDCHARVGEYALNYVEKMYCLGEECSPIYDIWKQAGRPVQLFKQRIDLVDALKKELKPLDVILLKGSRSKELWKVLEEL